MEQQQPFGRLGADVVAVLGHDRREPGRLARTLDRVDLDSRRRESMTTSQTSPAPTTSPTMSSQTLNSAFTAGSIGSSAATLPRMLDFTPDPIAFQLGPIPVYWYGIGYALGLAAAYLVMVRLARRAGEDAEILGNGIIIVAVAALIGGRLYHVIDQWALYKDDLIKIFLPPYSGLGVYGGIVDRDDRGVPVRPLQAASRSCAGPTSSRPGCS